MERLGSTMKFNQYELLSQVEGANKTEYRGTMKQMIATAGRASGSTPTHEH